MEIYLLPPSSRLFIAPFSSFGFCEGTDRDVNRYCLYYSECKVHSSLLFLFYYVSSNSELEQKNVAFNVQLISDLFIKRVVILFCCIYFCVVFLATCYN